MPKEYFNEGKEYNRKSKPLIFVLETSEKMGGEQISALNKAMANFTRQASELVLECWDYAVEIGVLTYDDSARWATPHLELLEYFQWTDCTTKGAAKLDTALVELNNQLRRSKLLHWPAGNDVPIIIFVSNSIPTDMTCNGELEQLLKNGWFVHASKIAITTATSSDCEVFSTLVGDANAVISLPSIEALESILPTAAIAATLFRARGSEELSNSGALIANNVREQFPEYYPPQESSLIWDSDW